MGDVDVPFGPGLLFTATDMPGFVLHVEICVDMFVPLPPSAQAALAGATVPITIGRAEDRCPPGGVVTVSGGLRLCSGG